MSSIPRSPSIGIARMYGELQAAADLTRLAFNDRGAPTTDAHTGADLFQRAGRRPLHVHTTAGLDELIGLLGPQLDQGRLQLETFDVALTLDPYTLRERFGTLLAALNRQVDVAMQGINLRTVMSAEAADGVRAMVAARGIDAETFQVGATSAYLDMLRMGKFAEADDLAAAFPPQASSGAAVFDASRVDPGIKIESLDDAKYRALESLGHPSGRAEALQSLAELTARGHIPRAELRAAVREHVLGAASVGCEIDPAFLPFIDYALSVEARDAREAFAREQLAGFAGDNYRHSNGSSAELYTSDRTRKRAELMGYASEGLLTVAEISAALRTSYCASLAKHGTNHPQTRSLAREPEVAEVPRAAIDAQLLQYAARLATQTPSTEWVHDVADHAPYFVDGADALMLGAAHLARRGMHRDPDMLAAIAERFPGLDVTDAGAVRPPLFVQGVDVRGGLARSVTSPEARALADVFCDWFGKSLTRFGCLNDDDPLGARSAVDSMREALVAALAMPQLEPAPHAALSDAIDTLMVKQGSTTRAALATEAEERAERTLRLGRHMRDALGGDVASVPYVALLELRRALVSVNGEIARALEELRKS